jgi:phosphocarrier protein
VKIRNETGLNTRIASKYVQKTDKYNSKIEIIFENNEFNAKIIMGTMSLRINKGNEFNVKTEGNNSKEAIEELSYFIEYEMIKEDK